MPFHRAFPTASQALSFSFALAVLPACGDTYNTYVYGGADAGPEGELPPGTPEADTEATQQAIDVFGGDKHHYWFVVDDAEVERMNNANGGLNPDDDFGDKYTPGGSSNATYADHLFVTTAEPETTADYGKVQVRVVGQSTFRTWTPGTIPNLRVDTNEFTLDKRIGNVEHLRFNNAQVGNVFRESIVYAIFREMGDPAPRTTYAWVGSNVWGPDVEIPYPAVEVYKEAFCKHVGDPWGGGCANIWEFAGELSTALWDTSSCQSGECDNTRLEEFSNLVSTTWPGPGFKAALSPYLDWPAFHRFHCMSWIFDLSDGAIHAPNNVVVVERNDGYFQYLPYSVDISSGFNEFGGVPLYGNEPVSRGCQADPECWADTISTCEATIADFAAADPVAVAERVYHDVATSGMLRDGDEQRFEQLVSWYGARIAELPTLLDQFRSGTVNCDFGWEWCNGGCVPIGECFGGCEPIPVDPRPIPEAGGGAEAPDGGAADVPLPDPGWIVPPGDVPPPVIPCKLLNAYQPE